MNFVPQFLLIEKTKGEESANKFMQSKMNKIDKEKHKYTKDDTKKVIREMYNTGYTDKEIANEVGKQADYVYNYLENSIKVGSLKRIIAQDRELKHVALIFTKKNKYPVILKGSK